MDSLIQPISPDRLADYAKVPMICDVTSMLAVEEIDDGLGGLALRERPVRKPYCKDYDACDDGGPLSWTRRFDVSQWGLWVARERGEIVGGAAVAWNTPEVHTLVGPTSFAVLWDLRVLPTSRRKGVGTALFREAARWTQSKGCRLLKIETQNVNVPACRFYAKMRCRLGRIDRLAYGHRPDLADEVMLVWYLDLSGGMA